MVILISGGCKNGKSYYAQTLAKELAEGKPPLQGEGDREAAPGLPHGLPLYYLATMDPHDEEDEARIRRHLKEREGWGFETIECPRNIGRLAEEGVNRSVGLRPQDFSDECNNLYGSAHTRHLERSEAESRDLYTDEKGKEPLIEAKGLGAVFLLDSTTALLANEMFLGDGSVDLNASERVATEIVALAKEIDAAGGSIVAVSDGIYSDAGRFDELTESYRKGLAHIDRALAKISDRVAEVSFGAVIDYK